MDQALHDVITHTTAAHDVVAHAAVTSHGLTGQVDLQGHEPLGEHCIGSNDGKHFILPGETWHPQDMVTTGLHPVSVGDNGLNIPTTDTHGLNVPMASEATHAHVQAPEIHTQRKWCTVIPHIHPNGTVTGATATCQWNF